MRSQGFPRGRGKADSYNTIPIASNDVHFFGITPIANIRFRQASDA